MKEQQAFPTIINSEVMRGMTLRDYFAGLAMVAIIASENKQKPEKYTNISLQSYIIADEMLTHKERTKP